MGGYSDKQTIQKWYYLYSDDIYRFILMLLSDHEQAKDLTQDTFIKAYANLENFKGESSDKSWLYTIARNLTIDYKRKKKPILYMIESLTSVPSERSCPEKIAQLGELERQLYTALRKLKRSYQEVIYLRKIKELSIRESAEILNWSENKVKTTLYRGMQALKKEMEKGGYEHEAIR